MTDQPTSIEPVRKTVTVPASPQRDYRAEAGAKASRAITVIPAQSHSPGRPARGMQARGRLVVLHNDLLASPARAVPGRRR